MKTNKIVVLSGLLMNVSPNFAENSPLGADPYYLPKQAAAVAVVGGSATNTELKTAVCINVTTGKSVTVKVPKGSTSWSCAASGFQTKVGDNIMELLSGSVTLPTKRIFVSSQHGDSNLGSWPQAGGKTGLAAGDNICQTLANNAGLGSTWKALLSDSGTNYKDRATKSNSPYVTMDGTKIASNFDELFDGDCNTLWSSKIDKTENGVLFVPQRFSDGRSDLAVRTGTGCGGNKTDFNSVQCGYDLFCNGWTSSSNWCVQGGTTVNTQDLNNRDNARCGGWRDGGDWSDVALFCVEQ